MKQRSAADHRDHRREYWLNVRPVRFRVVVFLLLYTLAGFLGLSWLLRTYAVETLKTNHDRELRIAETRVNPYALTLRIDGLELDDRDGELMGRFDRLLVDFTLLSLYNRAWTFETVDLDGLSIRAERFDTGETRLGRLAGELAAAAEDPEHASGEKAEGDLPRLVIEQLRLDNGYLRFRDHVPPEAVEFTLDPVNIEVNRIDTRPGREGNQSVRMELESGGTLDWQGTMQLVPFRAEGRIELREVNAGRRARTAHPAAGRRADGNRSRGNGTRKAPEARTGPAGPDQPRRRSRRPFHRPPAPIGLRGFDVQLREFRLEPTAVPQSIV